MSSSGWDYCYEYNNLSGAVSLQSTLELKHNILIGIINPGTSEEPVQVN